MDFLGRQIRPKKIIICSGKKRKELKRKNWTMNQTNHPHIWYYECIFHVDPKPKEKNIFSTCFSSFTFYFYFSRHNAFLPLYSRTSYSLFFCLWACIKLLITNPLFPILCAPIHKNVSNENKNDIQINGFENLIVDVNNVLSVWKECRCWMRANLCDSVKLKMFSHSSLDYIVLSCHSLHFWVDELIVHFVFHYRTYPHLHRRS